MPASRAEIYVRNDSDEDTDEQTFILRAKELDAGTDKWPEIQLAEIVLGPNKVASKIALARNAPQQGYPVAVSFAKKKPAEAPLPKGCVRDLQKGEHRRVTFWSPGLTSKKRPTKWSVSTEIMRLKDGKLEGGNAADGFNEDSDFDSAKDARIGVFDNNILVGGIPFEEYVKEDSTIDWHKDHVCIRLDNDAPLEQSTSYMQLWVLRNGTGSLHNFHIHQMKFRLATESELKAHYIKPPEHSHMCSNPEFCTCSEGICSKPDYKFYEKDPEKGAPKVEPTWHDTIPVPVESSVYIIMSYTAQEQIGRYVFHCHILKHEDTGLMAPMEVWARYQQKVDR